MNEQQIITEMTDYIVHQAKSTGGADPADTMVVMVERYPYVLLDDLPDLVITASENAVTVLVGLSTRSGPLLIV